MTQNAIIVMSISVGTIVLLFLYCISKVMFSPSSPPEED